MKDFVALYDALDTTTKTNARVAAMRHYFATATPQDTLWAAYLLSGNRFKRFITARNLRQWALELTGLNDWLFDLCYRHVGDSAETIAHLISAQRQAKQLDTPPEPHPSSTETALPQSLSGWITEQLLPLRHYPKSSQQSAVLGWWQHLSTLEIFVLNKILTGGFRVGVSKGLVFRALAEHLGLEPAVIAHRLSGHWQPSETLYQQLTADDAAYQLSASQPYPFYLAYPFEDDPTTLGPPSAWCAEWKWDGIRAQLICRGDTHLVWSRGEEQVNEAFPEVVALAQQLPEEVVLDGELLAYYKGAPLPFGQLQQRLGRKNPSEKLQNEVPVVLMAYDLLEYQGEDWRPRPLHERKAQLHQCIHTWGNNAFIADKLIPSPVVAFSTWEGLSQLREESRARGVEGLMLKRWDSPYLTGRKRGDWWKWKVNPYTVDAVMLYAQPGSGRRANLYTDYTFAVRMSDTDDQLVPVAKAYSGLSDEEIRKVDGWIRRNTIERFGPVRSVKAEQVFELAFEGIRESKRHKSGVALRFPRINRWRTDKTVQDIDILDTLKALI